MRFRFLKRYFFCLYFMRKMVVNTALLFIQITTLIRDSQLGKRRKIFSKIDVY